ncbi:hypothetical protein AVEN_55467-1, partial [Araneus ventricosus]
YVWALTDSWQPLFSDPVSHCPGQLKETPLEECFVCLSSSELDTSVPLVFSRTAKRSTRGFSLFLSKVWFSSIYEFIVSSC